MTATHSEEPLPDGRVVEQGWSAAEAGAAARGSHGPAATVASLTWRRSVGLPCGPGCVVVLPFRYRWADADTDQARRRPRGWGRRCRSRCRGVRV